MTERIPNLDLKFFATAVILQRQTGGDLAEILDKIGRLIREFLMNDIHALHVPMIIPLSAVSQPSETDENPAMMRVSTSSSLGYEAVARWCEYMMIRLVCFVKRLGCRCIVCVHVTDNWLAVVQDVEVLASFITECVRGCSD